MYCNIDKQKEDGNTSQNRTENDVIISVVFVFRQCWPCILQVRQGAGHVNCANAFDEKENVDDAVMNTMYQEKMK